MPYHIVRVEVVGEAHRQRRHRRRASDAHVWLTTRGGSRRDEPAATLGRPSKHRAHVAADEPGVVAIVEAEAEALAVVLLHHLARPPAVVEIPLDACARARIELGREERHVAQPMREHLGSTSRALQPPSVASVASQRALVGPGRPGRPRWHRCRPPGCARGPARAQRCRRGRRGRE